jgi:methyl-accepting chemotaxis protein
MFIKNLKIQNKFILLIIVPLFLILGLSMNRLYNSYLQHELQKDTYEYSRILVLDSELIHELQKERGLTAGFLASKKEKGKTEVLSQREIVDKVIFNFKEFFNSRKEEINSSYSEKHNSLFEELILFRKKINEEDVPVSKEINFYSEKIYFLLSQMLLIKSKTEDYKILEILDFYYRLVQLKEFSGIERATINSVLNKKEFDDLSYDKWIGLVANQDTIQKEIRVLNNSDFIQIFDKYISDELVKNFENKRITVKNFKETKVNSLESKIWWETTTNRINQFKKIENEISTKIQEFALKQLAISKQNLLLDSVFLIISLTLLFYISSKILNDMLQNIQLCISKNETVSMGKLNLIEFENRKDEFGQLYKSIDKMIRGLREILIHLIKISDSLKTSANEITASANHSAGISSELAASIQEAESAIENMNYVFNSISDKTDKSQKELDSLNISIEKLQVSMDTINQSSNTIHQRMYVAEQNISNGKVEVQIMNEAMTEIVSKASELNTSLGIINDISDQINLLSLNASIEAARSGEHGRGFAIVAKSISSLADSTEENVKKINSLIRLTNLAIQRGLGSSEKTSLSIQEIEKFILESKKDIQYIDNKIKLQFEETNHFQKNIQDYSILSKEIKDLTGQFKSSVEIIRDTFYINSNQAQVSSSNAEELAAVSEVILNYSEELKLSVDRFELE